MIDLCHVTGQRAQRNGGTVFMQRAMCMNALLAVPPPLPRDSVNIWLSSPLQGDFYNLDMVI